MLIYLYPLFFGLFFFLIKEKKNNPFYASIIFIYFLSSIFSVYIYIGDGKYGGSYMDLDAILFHCLCLLMLLLPLRRFERFRKIRITKENNSTIFIMSLFFIFCGLYAFFEIIPKVSLFSIISETQELRTLMDTETIHDSYFTYFGVKYWTVSLVLAFYNIRFNPHNKILIIFLFISSLCYIVDGLRFAGRECLLKYAFLFIVFLYFFSDGMSDSWKRILKFGLFIGGGVGVAFFAIITFMRFDISQVEQQSSVQDSIISYFGQGFVNFPSRFHFFPNGLSHGHALFPFFFGYGRSSFDSSGLDLKTFSTSIGSWVQDLGILGAFVLTCIYTFLLRLVTRIKCNVFTFIYVAWSLEFIFSLLFFYNDLLNGSRVISLFAIIMFDILVRNSKSVRT